MSKREVRTAIRQALLNVSAQNRSLQSKNVAKLLRNLPAYQNARKIALYLHMDNELETTDLITAAFEDDKRVFLPKIVKVCDAKLKSFERQKTHLQMLEVHSAHQALNLAPQGKYQIREPLDGTNCFDAAGLDLIVLPAMGFTKDCSRIGHGAGYYDSFIEEHVSRAGKLPTLVGVGLKEQLIDLIPLEPHDKPMNAVIINDTLYEKK